MSCFSLLMMRPLWLGNHSGAKLSPILSDLCPTRASNYPHACTLHVHMLSNSHTHARARMPLHAHTQTHTRMHARTHTHTHHHACVHRHLPTHIRSCAHNHTCTTQMPLCRHTHARSHNTPFSRAHHTTPTHACTCTCNTHAPHTPKEVGRQMQPHTHAHFRHPCLK